MFVPEADVGEKRSRKQSGTNKVRTRGAHETGLWAAADIEVFYMARTPINNSFSMLRGQK